MSFKKLIFADDIVFLTKQNNVNLLLKYLENMTVNWNLFFNKKKSGIMYLHKRNSDSKSLRGFPIVKEYKYLGITINNMGSIYPHIKNLKGLLKRIALKLKWLVAGSDFTKMVEVWSLIIKPHFLYMAVALNIQKFKKYY